MGGNYSSLNLWGPTAEDLNEDPSYQYINSSVPENTIKRGYDIYSGNDYTDMVKASKVLGGGDNRARDCGKTTKVANTIFVTDDKWHNGQHRYIDCGLTCNNCDAWPKQADAPKGPITGFKSPIGVNTQILEGSSGNRVEEDRHTCFWGENQRTALGWNWGDNGNKEDFPEKLPDEVATGCAGGGKSLRGKFPKTLNGYKIKNSSGKYSDECYVGTPRIKGIANASMCLRSDISKPTFCQMGDYLESTQLCKRDCDYKENTLPLDKQYCNLAYERLCQKRKGDPIKRDDNGNIIYSDKDYIKSPICLGYCGGPEDARCKKIKDDICSRNETQWLQDDWIPGYCKTHWKTTKDTISMDKACKTELLKENGEQNIFSGKGCGTLCMGNGTDVDENWCNSIKAQYCRKNDTNMLTDDCYNFCAGHPDLCDDYLSGNKGMCSRLNIKTQEDLEKNVPNTKYNYSDWCGCMMPTDFYVKYAGDIDAKFNEFGYSILGQIDLSPECMYPLCKQGSIMTDSQYKRKRDGMCTDCVQIMLQSLNGSFVDSEIVSEQSINCGKINQEFLLPGVYNVNDAQYIRVFDDKKYCTYSSEKSKENDKVNHTFEEDYNISSIPSENASIGQCDVLPGSYLVTSVGKYIYVHDNGEYCIFPETFVPKDSNEFKKIKNIPMMNKLSLENPECEPPSSTESIILFEGVRIGTLNEKDSNTIIYFLIGLAILFFLVGIAYAYIYRRGAKKIKKNY